MKKKEKSVKKRVFKKKIEETSDEEDNDLTLESDDDPCDDENNCIECGENYFSTIRKEDWIQCLNCRFWVHEDCTSFENYCQKCGRRANSKNV